MAAGGADSSYKVVLVGDLEVGKTTLYNRFKHGQFVDGGDERQTRQEAEHSKTWQHGGETYSVRLSTCRTDTHAQPMFSAITVNVYIHMKNPSCVRKFLVQLQET